MPKTIREKLVEALFAQGYVEVPSRSRKYRTMTKDHCSYLYLGSAGSLRKGRTHTESLPVDSFKHQLLKVTA